VFRLSVRNIVVLAIACAALAVPAGAGAATVVNGDFETGNLSGWQVSTSSDAGNWYAYSGTRTPKQSSLESDLEEEVSFFAPPQGTFAAVSDESNQSTVILYQDVALEPLWTHQLTLSLYYKSYDDIVVPSPNTLATDDSVEHNQQLRVDVMKPTAAIDSLAPADTLATVFANKTGDPMVMGPTTFGADLTPFAGQTVRLRVANAVQDFVFNTGVDAVSILSTPPSNTVARKKLTLNRKNGTGKLAVKVQGPGILVAVGRGTTKKVKRTKVSPTGAGIVRLALNPTAAGRKILNRQGKLKTRIDVFFTPTGGLVSDQNYGITLRKTLAK